MALVKCPECGKDLSSEARGCPHCGYSPMQPSKRAPVGWGFRILFGIFALFIGLVILGSIGNNANSERDAKARAECNPGVAKVADTLVEKMIKEDLFYRIDGGGNFPRIYVKENWYLVPIDGKITFDEILQCHFTQGKEKPLLGVYIDHRSGKTVANTGGASGFRME